MWVQRWFSKFIRLEINNEKIISKWIIFKCSIENLPIHQNRRLFLRNFIHIVSTLTILTICLTSIFFRQFVLRLIKCAVILDWFLISEILIEIFIFILVLCHKLNINGNKNIFIILQNYWNKMMNKSIIFNATGTI